MTNEEAKTALFSGQPVMHKDIRYSCVSAIIYRKGAGTVLVQLELLDKCGNSVTIAAPERVTLAEV